MCKEEEVEELYMANLYYDMLKLPKKTENEYRGHMTRFLLNKQTSIKPL